MKILVTCCEVFIGSHLVDKLVSEGNDVIAIDSLEKQVHTHFPSYLNPRANYFFGRLEDHPFLKDTLNGVKVIFHTASKVGVAQSRYEIYDFYKANVSSTAFFLQKCTDSDVKKIIFSGSMAPYGEGPHICSEHRTVYPETRATSDVSKKSFECKCPLCNRIVKNIAINEQQPPHPLSFYALTKQAQESMIHMFGKMYGVKTISLRYFSVYGSRQTLGNPYAGPIPIFISKVLKGEAPRVFEDGHQTRDFIHVQDVVNASLLAMKKGVSQSNYNIGTGKSTTILGLANAVCLLLHSSIKPIITGDFRPGDIRHSLADISKAKKDLRFMPTVSMTEGLREILGWVKQISN
jgi:dTDP-L-rhamnose 4-epimerase